MKPNETEEVQKSNKELCLEELNAVLKKYNLALVPTFNLVDVKPAEVASEENDD